jgi:uncharacterized protein
MSIQLRWVNKKRRYNLQGGTILDGFPSTGLVNAIAIECLIRSVRTELVAILDSPEFPPVSLVTDGRPQFPARIYVNESLKVAFFISELDIHPTMQREAARTILQWATDNKCKTIISSASITRKLEQASDSTLISSEISALGSTDAAREMIAQKGFVQIRTGVINGIPAILLNEASWMGIDVIVMLVNAASNSPDFAAATLLSKAISKIVPGIYCDLDTLMKEGELIENNIKGLRDNHNKISPYR